MEGTKHPVQAQGGQRSLGLLTWQYGGQSKEAIGKPNPTLRPLYDVFHKHTQVHTQAHIDPLQTVTHRYNAQGPQVFIKLHRTGLASVSDL